MPAAADAPIYFGGPVQTDRGFVLHAPAGDWQSTLRVRDAIGLTTSKDILEAVGRGEGPATMLVIARLRRLVGRAARARAVSRTPGSRWKRATASSSTRRPKSACPRRWSCSASTSRGCRTKRDMPEEAERPARVTISPDHSRLRFRSQAYWRRSRRAGIAHRASACRAHLGRFAQSRSWWRNGSRRIAGRRVARLGADGEPHEMTRQAEDFARRLERPLQAAGGASRRAFHARSRRKRALGAARRTKRAWRLGRARS